VLGICTTVREGNDRLPLDAERLSRLDAFCQCKGGEGFRVLAVATRHAAAQPDYGHADEQGMTL
jgi:magnesium-transporting ATPase (P-type)